MVFRETTGCVVYVFALKQIVDSCKENERDYLVEFIYLEKAYD